MMRYLLLLLLLSLSLSSYAQEDEGWPVTENCLGELPYPTIPQEDWDFEGVIFSYNGLGVRAIRTDVETSYYIAFSSMEGFPTAGGFSPDGQWFAYPTGYSNDYVNMIGDSSFDFMGINVVSTDPRNLKTSYELPEGYGFYIYAGIPFVLQHINPIVWRDNETLIYLGEHGSSTYLTLNINTGEFVTDLPVDETLRQFASPYDDTIWLNDDRGFIKTDVVVSARFLQWFNQESELIELIAQGNNPFGSMSLSPEGQHLTFINTNQLQIADLTNHSVENLCIQVSGGPAGFSNILWSPDGSHLIFLYDGYPVLVNLETRQMQILRYQTGSLMGWYPLPEE
jgi:hypothetical protein